MWRCTARYMLTLVSWRFTVLGEVPFFMFKCVNHPHSSSDFWVVLCFLQPVCCRSIPQSQSQLPQSPLPQSQLPQSQFQLPRLSRLPQQWYLLNDPDLNEVPNEVLMLNKSETDLVRSTNFLMLVWWPGHQDSKTLSEMNVGWQEPDLWIKQN